MVCDNIYMIGLYRKEKKYEKRIKKIFINSIGM